MSFECQSAGLEYDQSSCHCRNQDYPNPTCPDGCQVRGTALARGIQLRRVAIVSSML